MHASPARIALLCGALLVLGASAAARAAESAPDAAPAVTQANLLENDRYWPYHVSLVEAWAPAMGVRPLRPKTQGVLIRVEGSGLARIDFGRDGRFDVPVASTDLIERANRIRLGAEEKTLPNFVLALAPRLIDSSGELPRTYPLERSLAARCFLTVFVDPASPAFAAIAKALAPLAGRSDLLTMVVPQGEHSDVSVREKLRANQWPVPFVYDHLAEAYTRTLIDPERALPALALQTPDGRLLFETSWSAQAPSDLRAALDAALGTPPTPQQETKS